MATDCVDCGNPFEGLGSRCEPCLNRRHYEQALEQQIGIFAEKPDLAVLVTKRRPPQIVHLALVGHASVAFCGMPLQSRASHNWSQVGPNDEFRKNTCSRCLELFERVTGRRVGITEARI